MRPTLAVPFALLVTSLATSSPADADADADAAPELTVGARVGGYGFRRPGAVGDHGHVAWDDCRMNGMGVFARRPLGRLFAEAGADVYFAESFPMASAEAGEMDRMSGLFTVAAGAELVRTRRFTGYAQVGAGLELTRVAMPVDGGPALTDQRALPLGFLGFGGEVKLGGRTALGASLRTHVMGHFDHDEPVALDGAAARTADHGLEVAPEIAAQGQFYLSYRL